MVMMEAALRIRLEFEDGHILSDAQKSEGLKQSWVLFDSKAKSISDLSSHILHSFQLQRSCPDGLLLSMDGFVLPPFESTCILKDKDIISVKKKGVTWLIKGSDEDDSAEKLEVVQKQPVNTGALLLANEEFEKESGGFLSEESEDESGKEDGSKELVYNGNKGKSLGEDENPKKRKASEKLKGSKRRKLCSQVEEDNGNDAQTGMVKNPNQDGVSVRKKSHKKEKKSDLNSKAKLEDTEESAEPSDDNIDDTSNKTKKDQPQENADSIVNAAQSPETRKGPSRSARRKYAKRRWLREMAKIQKKDDASRSEGIKNWKLAQSETAKLRKKDEKNWKLAQTGTKKFQKKDEVSRSEAIRNWKLARSEFEKDKVHQSNGLLPSKISFRNDQASPEELGKTNLIGNTHGQTGQSDADDEVVPVEVKPGHIRFEPLGKGPLVEQSTPVTETYQWNGITSKKKGQKWGTEKFSSQRNNFNQKWAKDSSQKNNSNQKSGGEEFSSQRNNFNQKWGEEKYTNARDDSKDVNEDLSEMQTDSEDHSETPTGTEDHTETPNSSEDHPETPTSSEDHSEMPNSRERMHVAKPVDFEKLPVLPGLPKEGDVLAYRVLELSSSWTPELSSFRVGKVSWFNTESNKIMLMPLPEYPIAPKTSEDESAMELVDSLYNEDGSLEVEFASLVDVRAFGSGNSDSAEAPRSPKTSADNQKTDMDTKQIQATSTENGVNHATDTSSPNTENGGVNLWDQFTEVLNAKKAELSQEDNWRKPTSGSKSPWSCADLRGSAPSTAKKAQLSQEDNWGNPVSGSKRPWTHAEIRGGPPFPSKKAQPSQEDRWGMPTSGKKSWTYAEMRGPPVITKMSQSAREYHLGKPTSGNKSWTYAEMRGGPPFTAKKTSLEDNWGKPTSSKKSCTYAEIRGGPPFTAKKAQPSQADQWGKPVSSSIYADIRGSSPPAAKKAQPPQGDNLDKQTSGSKSSWPHKALRGSALGPTMALLRSKNQIAF